MRLIKRYSNRKLYDTTTKNYVTLDSIGAMVNRGEEIQVLDNDTNEDLTSVILSQLLLEREREQPFLPSGILSQLWRAGKEVTNLGQTLADLTRPLVPGSVRQFLDQEVERSFKIWFGMVEGQEDELLLFLENLIEQRRHALRPTNASVTKPSEPPHPTNPVTATLRRFGVRSRLDDFEDWSDSPANSPQNPNRPTTNVTSHAIPIKPKNTESSNKSDELPLISRIAQLQASLAQLSASEQVKLRPQLEALQAQLQQLLADHDALN